MFTDDLLPLAVEDANSVRQSTQKRYFISENCHFLRTIYCLKIRLLVGNSPMLCLRFVSVFQKSNCYH